MNMSDLIDEANALPKEPYESGYIPQDVLVIVIDRASVEFDSEPSAIDYERIRIKPNPYILAVAGMTQDNDICRNSYRALRSFPQRLQQKAMIAFKMLIGSFGIYPFQRIWNLTVPETWRTQKIDPTPGNYR